MLLVFFASLASADVAREGEWPDDDPKVTLSVTNLSRSEALRRLADEAKWSVVVEIPPGNPVDVHVKDQPASKVLELLLSDGHYVAHRDGTLIDIHVATDVPPRQAQPRRRPHQRRHRPLQHRPPAWLPNLAPKPGAAKIGS